MNLYVSKESIMNGLSSILKNTVKEIHSEEFDEPAFWDLFGNIDNGILDTGASKGVFIPCGGNYVIKTPFLGYLDNWDEYDEELDDYFERQGFTEFEGAYLPKEKCYSNNYCESEMQYYECAEMQGISDFFPETRYLGEYEGIPFYIQERATIIGGLGNSKPSENSKSLAKEVCEQENFSCFNETWFGSALDYYGAERLALLVGFLKEYHLRDFHNGNIGYIGDRPVIIDFSDFDS